MRNLDLSFLRCESLESIENHMEVSRAKGYFSLRRGFPNVNQHHLIPIMTRTVGTDKMLINQLTRETGVVIKNKYESM